MDPQPVIDAIVTLAQNALYLCLPILAGFAVRWLAQQAKLQVEKLNQEQLNTFNGVVGWAVQAAEQLKLNQQIADKKQYVMALLQDYLAERGVKLDVALIESAVEAAVYATFNKPAAAGAPQA